MKNDRIQREIDERVRVLQVTQVMQATQQERRGERGKGMYDRIMMTRLMMCVCVRLRVCFSAGVLHLTLLLQ